MKEIVVLSGKGGTGKTVVTSSLASMAENAVLVDADVDAANLELVLQPIETRLTEAFTGGDKPVRDADLCDLCGVCHAACRFDAIDESIDIDLAACEGCGLCHHVCPNEAIRMEPRIAGEVFVSGSPRGTLVHARLIPGEENSGKLVSQVRKRGREIASAEEASWILVDGPPGIGCPAIASLGGADLALLVTEPGVTAIHDLERVIDLIEHFRVPAAVLINRCDISRNGTEEIRRRCTERGLRLLAEVPFDRAVVDAVAAGLSPTRGREGPAVRAFRGLWRSVSTEAARRSHARMSSRG